MPSKHITRQFSENSYYHVYNRGVEKRTIFEDQQDYNVFTVYLRTYLLPKDNNLFDLLSDPDIPWKEKSKILKLLRLKNFSDRIQLHAYCLMPNHFHLLLYQSDATAIDNFMNSLCTRYVMYFNKKYNRVGPLFQGVYKSVAVNTDEQYIHLTRYIHKNPLSLLQGDPLKLATYAYSSYGSYIKPEQNTMVNREEIKNHFLNNFPNSYRNFVEDLHQDELTVHHVKNIQLE